VATSPYEWNSKAARYRDPATGRFISRDTVRKMVDQLIEKSRARVQTASEQLRSGTIDLGEWDAVMRQEIKRTQLSTTTLLRGGWNQMTAADYGRVGANVRAQYRYLEGFVTDLRSGKQRLDGSFFNRAKMYPASARVTFHEQLTQQLDDLGYVDELNVLHPAEHCAECIDASARGWVPIGTNVPIGQRQCRGNDRCSMRYR
jgi:hypothetical protein